MDLKKLLRLALLTAVSLILYLVENQISAPVPVPGVKLGLGNIIVLCVLFRFGWKEALAVLLVKVLLGSALTGNLGAVAYALAGGLLSLGGMCLLKPLLTDRQLFVGSVIGAMLHNLGQLLMAAALIEALRIFFYFPVLLFSGIAAGILVGIISTLVLRALR